MLPLLGAALFTTNASAQLVTSPRELTGLKLDDLAALAIECGWSAEHVTDDDDDALLIVEINQRKLVLHPHACDRNGHCGGLYVFALIPSQASSQTVNDFNVHFNPARATIREGQVVLDRYIIGDFGVARGTLSIELQVQAGLIDDWWDFTRDRQANAMQVSFNPLLPEQGTTKLPLPLMEELDLKAPLLEVLELGNGPRPQE